ncbi:MAG TPA: sodium/proton-translocating pyrophosphatase, partial [Candidatus Kapabacteria bacterium]|nr:sodium/proton-translocating pyrophosphatase [Candidatus Kapabacteria bacterium]
MDSLLFLIPAAGIIALLYTYIRAKWISSQDPGNERMQRIARSIADGAMAFIKAEYQMIAIF